jgi:hypothetical protein
MTKVKANGIPHDLIVPQLELKVLAIAAEAVPVNHSYTSAEEGRRGIGSSKRGKLI